MTVSSELNRISILFLALALSACSVTPLPTVSSSEPHGLVVTQNHHAADDTYPVVVININGVNIATPAPGYVDQRWTDPERNTFQLAPGRYTLILMADISDPRHPFSRYDRSSTRRNQTIELDVEVGKIYTLAARHVGPRIYDWEPVVTVANR